MYSHILNDEAIHCQGTVSLERHKQGVGAGNYDSWQCVSAKSSQQGRRVIHPVVHCDVVNPTVSASLNTELEELQFNYLQTEI